MDRKLGSGERGGGRGPEPGSFVDQPGLHPRLLQRSFVLPPARLERRAGSRFLATLQGLRATREATRGEARGEGRGERGEGRGERGEGRGEWGVGEKSQFEPVQAGSIQCTLAIYRVSAHRLSTAWALPGPQRLWGIRKTLRCFCKFYTQRRSP